MAETAIRSCPNCGHWHVMYMECGLLRWLGLGRSIFTLTVRYECVNCGVIFRGIEEWSGHINIFWITTPVRLTWWQRFIRRKQQIQITGVVS